MKKIILVPLDDRPCNFKFPVQIASSRGIEVITPPKEYLGSYNDPGDPEKILYWLDEVSGEADSAVISSDMICYGGLVASRKNTVHLDDALRRISFLDGLKNKNPELNISVFSVLMRLSVTADSQDNKALWKDIFEYSVLSDKAERFPEPGDKKKLNELEAKLPRGIIDSYLAVRERNRRVNEACIDLAASGHADLVVIAKEDCARFGLHKKEEYGLKNRVENKMLCERVKFLNGADEISMCLLSRRILSSCNEHPKIAVRYSFGKGRDISLYEDAPLDRVVSDHIDLLGVIRVEPLKEAEKVIFVHSFEGEQRDLIFSQEVERDRDQSHHLKNFCSEIIMMGEIGKEAIVADVFYANGADRDFLDKFSKLGDPKSILSYAGWNTSSNSVGSALSAALLSGNRELLLLRYIEDIGYQTVVRKRLEAFLDGKGISPFDFKESYAEAEEFASREMRTWADGFFSAIGLKERPEIKISFPWKRTFEADCDIIFS